MKAKISSRKLLAAFLINIGIDKDKLETIYPVLDKKPKLPKAAFDEMLGKVVTDSETAAKVKAFMELDDVSDLDAIVEHDDAQQTAVDEMNKVFDLLAMMGVGDYCVFDPGIVRGLAYYTGVVFEVHDVVGDLRAVCGGGRYDNLLKDFGGPAVSGTGMGMGDCVLEILLREKGLLKDGQCATLQVDNFVAYTDMKLQKDAIKIAAQLREKGEATDISYKGGGLKKQLKQASNAGAKKCIILGKEFIEDKKLIVKDMTTGEQTLTDCL